MGLLDDAIREHIELKRRHGAASNELARLEDEAFGPPRSAERESPASTQLHAVEEAEPPHLSHEPAHHGDPADHLPHAEAHPIAPPVPPAPPAPVEPPAPAQPRPRAPAPEPVAQDPAPPASPPPPAAPPPTTSQPTREFDVDEVRAATGEAEQEAPPAGRAEEDEAAEDENGDVLEETPEFLQETPEHDRLWFEQRPPRDFDF